MKTNSLLLLLASLAILTTGARAAQDRTLDDVVVLPVYTVEAPRYNRVEKQINASLDEVRHSAKTPVVIPADFSANKAIISLRFEFAVQTQNENAGRVAKL